VRALHYRRVDFNDPGTVAAVGAVAGGQSAGGGPAEPVAAYLALPPAVFPAAGAALGAIGLPEGSRIVLEKPFGDDLQSAIALNALLARVAGVAGERAVFRVDHALALSTV
jgi:glucose-6-phosphate 1-dehydrogenase